MAYVYDYDLLRKEAQGRWEAILSALAPELCEAMEQAPRHVPCPVHGGKDGFRLFRDWPVTGGGVCNTCGCFPSGFSLLQWLRGWDFPKTLAAVQEALGGARTEIYPRVGYRHDPDKSRTDERLLQRLRQTWREAVPLASDLADPARLYLQNRGLLAAAEALVSCRCHPSLPYYEGKTEIGRYPALLAPFQDKSGRVVTLHRIYLNSEGQKAPVAHPKKTMPYPSDRKLAGAVVRLGDPGDDVLGLAEGLETALAVRAATGQVCWAATSAALLEAAVVPAHFRRVVIWGDNDRNRAGQKAALRLAERLLKEGRQVKVHIPKLPSVVRSWDWADVLLHQGADGFPQANMPKGKADLTKSEPDTKNLKDKEHGRAEAGF